MKGQESQRAGSQHGPLAVGVNQKRAVKPIVSTFARS